MKKVTMLKTALGSEDGIKVNTYQAGESYEIGDKLADVFVSHMRVAALTEEMKSIPQAPENKSFKPEIEVKAVEEEKDEDEDLPDKKRMKRK